MLVLLHHFLQPLDPLQESSYPIDRACPKNPNKSQQPTWSRIRDFWPAIFEDISELEELPLPSEAQRERDIERMKDIITIEIHSNRP
jgi:hypothetical protein